MNVGLQRLLRLGARSAGGARPAMGAAHLLPLSPLSLPERRREERRALHATPRADSVVAVGALGVAVAAFGLHKALAAYADHKAKGPGEKKRTVFTRKLYEGPFEEAMTRREAALILGVRESAAKTRIRDAHRRILMLNHPDQGGSTFLASKINEAKDVLLKGVKT